MLLASPPHSHLSAAEARSFRRGRLLGPNSVLTSPNRSPVGIRAREDSDQRTDGGIWWRGAGSIGSGYIPRVPMPQEIGFGPAVPVTENQVRMGLPPGVVVYPGSGAMTLTARTGATFVPLGTHFESLQFETGADGDTMRVVPRVSLSKEDLVKLRDAFHTLRMVFPVR